MLGLAIDFPTLNVLGFSCYTVSTAAFLYSPAIQSQYAYRHPDAPETTVRFNDFLFAAHGAVLCVIIYSQFFPRLWGFTVGKRQRASRVVLGIFWGGVLGILVVTLLARYGADAGYDPAGWAWIDVVRVGRPPWLAVTDVQPDIRPRLRQALDRRHKVHPTSLGQLQAKINRRMVHLSHALGFCWRMAFPRPAHHRLFAAERLVGRHW